MQRLIIGLITIYRYLLSPLLGPCCRYYPSCSVYTEQAVAAYGCSHGLYLGFKRLLRCHRWCEGGYDPVPNKKTVG